MKLFQFLFFLIYRFLFMPFALTLVFLFLWPFNKKIQAGLKLRREKKPKFNFQSQPIWIHASSGEFEYAKPVITFIKKLRPDIPIFVTYFSPSYAKAISSYPGVDESCPLPLDLPGPTRTFVQKLNPRLLLVARTDFWPELLRVVRKRNIPSLLFSSSFREPRGLRQLLNPYYRMIFSFFSHIMTVSKLNETAISSTGTTSPVRAEGDTRYDQVVARLENPKPLRQEILTSSKPVLVAGSTWTEDEDVLIEATYELIQKNKLRLILAPHEPTPTHLEALEKKWSRYAIPTVRYGEATSSENPILFIDRLGILAEIYTNGNFAFVGGSFKKKVHSVMEPLAAGLPTIVGPFHANNREAIEFQGVSIDSQLNAVSVVRNAKELRSHLEHLVSLDAKAPELRVAIRHEIGKRTGTSQVVASWAIEHY